MRVVNYIDHKKEIIQIFTKAWTDELFRQRLLNNPEEVLREFGIHLDKKLKIHLHFDSQEHLHLSFPLQLKDEELSEEQLKMLVGGAGLDPVAGSLIGASVAGTAAIAAF